MRKLMPAIAVSLFMAHASTAMAEDGEAVYRGAQPACSVCHDAGVAGAPVVGDAESWEDRLDKSIDALTATVLEGKGAMPAYEGNVEEARVRAAVEWMVDQTQE